MYLSKINKMNNQLPFHKTNLGIFTIVNTVLILVAVGVYLGIFFGVIARDWVDKKNCVAPIGEFTVEPAVDSSSPLTECPDSNYDEKGTCIYTNVPSLLQATRICNQKADICSRFVYNATSRKMKIVSLKSTPVDGSQDDNTYTRQANVTFKTSGESVGEIDVSTPSQAIPVADDGTVDPTAITTTTTSA
jgi:hypothetical protein